MMPLGFFLSVPAIVLLAVFVLLPVAAFAVSWKRSPLTFWQMILWSGNYVVARILWRTRVEGELPRDSGAVIVANHRSGVDPSFIQTCIRRVVYWMVAREYCETPGLGWLLKEFQVIPVGAPVWIRRRRNWRFG